MDGLRPKKPKIMNL